MDGSAPGCRVLGLCGSLRRASINRALLHAAAIVMPDPTRFTVHEDLGSLPLFNADLVVAPDSPVAELWRSVTTADAIVIASPEYAHGITGVLKNALDWLVGLPEFYGKQVAVLNASARASHADAALREVLSTMGARLVEEASITLPLTGVPADSAAILADPHRRAALNSAMAALARGAGT